jgi:hypothetical protein
MNDEKKAVAPSVSNELLAAAPDRKRGAAQDELAKARRAKAHAEKAHSMMWNLRDEIQTFLFHKSVSSKTVPDEIRFALQRANDLLERHLF